MRGIAEAAGCQERLQVVVAASRVDALANLAWLGLGVCGKSCRHHRSLGHARLDRPRTASTRSRWALELAGAIGLCYIGRSALSAAGSLVNFSVAQRCVRDLRVELLDQINRLSADYHEQTPTGEKLTRIEHDVDEIANLGADTANQASGRFCSLRSTWQ